MRYNGGGKGGLCRSAMLMSEASVIRWLLDGDPTIRWQVMRDLSHEREEVIALERARVATEGWGRALLERQAS